MNRPGDVTTQIGALMLRAIRRNAARVVRDLPAAARGDRHAIHDVRVASRRLRAALPIAGEAAGVDVRALSRHMRRVTRALAGVREADVVQDVIHELPAGDGWTPAAIDRLAGQGARQRERERRSARAALRRIDVGQLAAQLRALTRDLEAARTGPAMAAAFVAETRRRACSLTAAADEAGMVYAVEPLHRMRISVKKLRYVLEVGSPALPGVGGRAIRRLRRLQTLLGNLHDVQMVQQHIRAVAAVEAANVPPLVAELERLDQAMEVSCRKLHARILRARVGLDGLLGEVTRASASLLAPRALGISARMRLVGARRRVASR